MVVPPWLMGLFRKADSVDLAMEVRAGLTTRDRSEQRADQNGGEGDQAACRQRPLSDRNARKLKA
jgi:hypothetical protein